MKGKSIDVGCYCRKLKKFNQSFGSLPPALKCATFAPTLNKRAFDQKKKKKKGNPTKKKGTSSRKKLTIPSAALYIYSVEYLFLRLVLFTHQFSNKIAHQHNSLFFSPKMATSANEPTVDAKTESKVEQPKTRPTKPDEEAFKANLANAEKEHSIVQEKLVSCHCA